MTLRLFAEYFDISFLSYVIFDIVTNKDSQTQNHFLLHKLLQLSRFIA